VRQGERAEGEAGPKWPGQVTGGPTELRAGVYGQHRHRAVGEAAVARPRLEALDKLADVLGARVVAVNDQPPAKERLKPDLEASLFCASSDGLASAVFGYDCYIARGHSWLLRLTTATEVSLAATPLTSNP
jgi:hypothetical protein